jgi:PAS domain S-box-containing protein
MSGRPKTETQKVGPEDSLAPIGDVYRLMIENCSDITFTVGLDHHFTWVSPNLKSILGWDEGDFLGKNSVDFVH